jgi:hypothetical protein
MVGAPAACMSPVRATRWPTVGVILRGGALIGTRGSYAALADLGVFLFTRFG